MPTDSSMDTSEKPQTPSEGARTEAEILADLQRRQASRAPRQERTEAAAPGSSSNEEVRSVTCPRCGATRQVRILLIDGRPLFATRPSMCDPCSAILEQEKQEREARERADEERERAERRRAGILDLLTAAGVNAWDHGAATLDNFDPSQSGPSPVEAVREFLAEARGAEKYSPVRGLYLFGDTGSGKSHLAVAAARELLLDMEIDPAEIVFDHALRLIGRIQRTYNNDESADEVLDRRINARVWILDDLGTENPSADVVRRLTEIFTERAMRPTIVTSNLAPNQLEGRHTEFYRISSRLGPRYFRTVQVRGADRRFTAA